jgi:hypothetical protein
MLFASAPTLESMQAAITDFYCGTQTRLEPDGDAWRVVRQSDGKTLDGVRVVNKGRRYRFEAA